MKYKFENLSPIHVGSGGTYSSLNIYSDQDEIFILNEDAVVRKLLEQGLSYQMIIEKLDSIVAGESEKLIHFLSDEKIRIDEFEAKYRLKNRTGITEIKEIKENTKSMKGLCISGSSIKGAIRTAVFHEYIKEKGIDFINDIVNFFEGYVLKNSKYRNVSIDDYILYLYGKSLDSNRKPNRMIDPKKDPFKYLIVRDVDFSGDVAGVVYREGIINSRKTGNTIEVIPQDCLSNIFEIKIENQENLLRLTDISKVNKDILKYMDEEKLKECIYEHSKDILENEIEYYTNLEWTSFNRIEVISLLKRMKAINSKETPIIRLGKDTGLFSHSIALTVKAMDPEFYEDYFVDFLKRCNRSFKMYKNLGFPKTRKFIGEITSPRLLGFTLLKKAD